MEKVNYFLQQLINGISCGSIYAMIAIGYSMVYGLLYLVNFAHGDLYVFGTFIAYSLMLDEPSLGLAPVIVAEVYKIIEEINKEGTSILLVEQNAKKALSIANRAYILVTGEITLTGEGKQLLEDDSVRQAYLGV